MTPMERIMGRWPGDETDKQIEQALRPINKVAYETLVDAIADYLPEDGRKDVERHVKNLFSKDIDKVESALFGLYCIIYKITDVA